MRPEEAAIKQFKSAITTNLNRWHEESDLDADELVTAALEAIEKWANEEVLGFEADEDLST
jgi:hypothetical protein